MCLAAHTVERHPSRLFRLETVAAVAAGTEVAGIHPLSRMAEAEVEAVDTHPCSHIAVEAEAEAAGIHLSRRTLAEVAAGAVDSRLSHHIVVADTLHMDSLETLTNTGSTVHHNFHMEHMHWHMGSPGRGMLFLLACSQMAHMHWHMGFLVVCM
jgi:hypothetical protein